MSRRGRRPQPKQSRARLCGYAGPKNRAQKTRSFSVVLRTSSPIAARTDNSLAGREGLFHRRAPATGASFIEVRNFGHSRCFGSGLESVSVFHPYFFDSDSHTISKIGINFRSRFRSRPDDKTGRRFRRDTEYARRETEDDFGVPQASARGRDSLPRTRGEGF
jgi:hypothetical protein